MTDTLRRLPNEPILVFTPIMSAVGNMHDIFAHTAVLLDEIGVAVIADLTKGGFPHPDWSAKRLMAD